LGEELKALFEAQRKYGNPHADTTLEAEILGNGDKKSGIFWQQNPALSGEKLLVMVGECFLERQSGRRVKRAPKASFSAERQVWLTRLNNLKIVIDGKMRFLNKEERDIALPLPYQDKQLDRSANLTYKKLRHALTKAKLLEKDSFKFAGLSYGSKAEEKSGNPEDATLIKLEGWKALRDNLRDSQLDKAWQEDVPEIEKTSMRELLDKIAYVLTVYKEDDEVCTQWHEQNLPKEMLEPLSTIRFDKFHSLSLDALRKILPYMEQGQLYNDACVQAGYHHSQSRKPSGGKKFLPNFYEQGKDRETGKPKWVLSDQIDGDINGGIPRNPVVLRALNQARKVVNAIIARYGLPHSVHIELARDLSRPFEERDKIRKEQDKYHDRNEELFNGFIEIFGRKPKEGEFEKWRLYHEQGGKSLYSQDAIDLNHLLEPGFFDVDHVLPWARSYDDSKNNKVLVFAKENRDKSDKTPYEYLDGANESKRWRDFEAFVKGNPNYRDAKRNYLLRENFGEENAEKFRARNLNDTRYICRFFKNFVEYYLQPERGVVVVNGGLVSLLRSCWGLPGSKKKRRRNDRHHALDAAVVAACGRLIVQKTSTLLARGEWIHKPEFGGYVNTETSEVLTPQEFARKGNIYKMLPRPWKHFREELLRHLEEDDPVLLKSSVQHLRPDVYSAEELDALRPLFVSRAPQRRNGGAAHKDTIYGQPKSLNATGSVTQKVALSALSLKDMGNLIDPHRNERLYAAIRKRLEEHGGKGDKAFPAGTEFRKPDKNGNLIGPIVRTVTMVINKLFGIPVRGGIAKNETMLRVDVFSKAGRFHLVPVYVHHRVTGLPNRAIVAGKDEEKWDLMDESFTWCFSLYPNDLVRIKTKKETFFGYYDATDRSTGAISIWAHDRNQAIGKDGLIRGIGVKTALKFEKFEVDVLGGVHPFRPEPRRGLA
jgi:CRISPR-associated endonuclease Csn1